MTILPSYLRTALHGELPSHLQGAKKAMLVWLHGLGLLAFSLAPTTSQEKCNLRFPQGLPVWLLLAHAP